MNLNIKNATIIDPGSALHGKKRDIIIENGNIVSIGVNLKSGKPALSSKNLHVSPGWFDMHVNFADPGYEQKEDLKSGCRAAAAGGFTGVACMPSTNPLIDSKSGIEYVINKTKKSVVDVYPVGAITSNLLGNELTEMADMHSSGAIAFSDGKKHLSNAGVMLRALLYTNIFNGLIISHSEDPDISLDGQMNEGPISASSGLKGMPAIAEEISVARDISLAEYAGSRLHFSSISTSKSVDLIRNAKKAGLRITAEVAAHYLALDDSNLAGFDSNFKVKPPLRSKEDIKALKKGLTDGTIDVICSDHYPEEEEMKKREFDHAAYGIIGLETAFAVANTFSGLPIDRLIAKLSIRPREILGLPVPAVEEGASANLTIFDPDKEWIFTVDDIKSKSKNSPFIGTKFKGKVLAVYNNRQLSEI